MSAGVLAASMWACSSDGGPRDRNYGTDAGAGYAGPAAVYSDGGSDGESDGGTDLATGDGDGDTSVDGLDSNLPD